MQQLHCCKAECAAQSACLKCVMQSSWGGSVHRCLCESEWHLACRGQVGHELGVLGLQDGQLQLLLSAGVRQLVILLAQACVHPPLTCTHAHSASSPTPCSTKSRCNSNASMMSYDTLAGPVKLGFPDRVPQLTGWGVLAVGLHIAAAGLCQDDIIPEVPDLRHQ